MRDGRQGITRGLKGVRSAQSNDPGSAPVSARWPPQHELRGRQVANHAGLVRDRLELGQRDPRVADRDVKRAVVLADRDVPSVEACGLERRA